MTGPTGDTGSVGPTGEKKRGGEQGEKGDKGERGEKGDTPVKGVDYFTDSDIDDIVEKMLICINGNGVAY